MKTLNSEEYKGYSVKFVERIIGPKRYVEGGYMSKVNNKIIKVKDLDKSSTYNIIKRMIDFEISKKRLERIK